jgi:hypothetical protein
LIQKTRPNERCSAQRSFRSRIIAVARSFVRLASGEDIPSSTTDWWDRRLRVSQNLVQVKNRATVGGPDATASGFRRNKRSFSQPLMTAKAVPVLNLMPLTSCRYATPTYHVGATRDHLNQDSWHDLKAHRNFETVSSRLSIEDGQDARPHRVTSLIRPDLILDNRYMSMWLHPAFCAGVPLARHYEVAFGQEAARRIVLDRGACDGVRWETGQKRPFHQRDSGFALVGPCVRA